MAVEAGPEALILEDDIYDELDSNSAATPRQRKLYQRGSKRPDTQSRYHVLDNPRIHSQSRYFLRSTTMAVADPPTEELATLTLEENLYGCTFCGAPFIDKSEWRRHESSSHIQNELWRCDTSVSDQADQCGSVFFAAPDLKRHLDAAHGIDVEDDYVEDRHVYTNHQRSFWCGFCREVRPLYEMGQDAWTERFEHIEEHLEEQPISDWLRLKR